MKSFLSIVIIIFVVLLTNITIFAQEIENDSRLYENELAEESSLPDLETDLSDNEIESRIIIGSGIEYPVETLFLDKYATYYFSRLTNNFGNNYIGSCSYTAAAMLLSYYDTYWDDDIIPEHYEQNKTDFNRLLSIEDLTDSPGIIGESIPSNINKENYADFVDINKDTYFHLNLISIGFEQNIDFLDDYSLFPSEVKNLLEYYLYNVVGFSSSEVTVDHITGFENVREYTINKVKQGIPVFVSGASIDGKAHSYIIYDYDEDADELYCHLGWYKNTEINKEYTHIAFSSIDYTLFEGAVTINFESTSEHSHSDNYVDSEGNTYCSCYFSCHPEHEHRYKLQEGSPYFHTYDCSCAPPQYELHEYIYINTNNDNTHTKKCTKCEYQIEQNHRWEKTYNDETHTFTCIDCGHVKTDFHNIEIESCDSTAHRYYCTGCDYSVAEEHIKTHTSVDDILHFVKCSVCEYEGNEYHSTKYADLGDGTHSDSCEECGYYSIENHAFVCKSVDGTYHRSVCDACGLVNGANEAHVWGPYSNPKYFKCTLCGHLKLVTGPGIIPINPTNKNDEIEETE